MDALDGGDQFKATTLLNRKQMSCVDTTRTKARARLILKVVTEMETLENEIVVEKPFVIKLETSSSVSESSINSPMTISVVDDSDETRGDDFHPKIAYYKRKALNLLHSEELRRRRKDGLFISPKRVLGDVLGHLKINFVSYNKYGSFDHRVTIDFCGELVEGKGKKCIFCAVFVKIYKKELIFRIEGHNEHVAEQNACKLVFIEILKIDWNRAVGERFY